MPTFPNGYHHSEDLPHKQLAGLAFLPPRLRVKVAITRAGHTHIDAAWEDVPEDVPGAAGGGGGGEDHGAVAFFCLDELCQCFGLFQFAVPFLRDANNHVFWYVARGPIVFP